MRKERKIYLLRHGELYEEGGIHRCLGHTDVPLTERGESQAKKIAKWFHDKEIERIYTSPFQRCVKTAQAVKEELEHSGRGAELIMLDGLREMGAGEWENLSFEEIRRDYPEEYEARGKQLGYYAPPGGESFHQAGRRFGECLEGIRKGTEGNILIVAHAGVIRGYMCGLLNISLNDIFAIPQPYAGITILREMEAGLVPEKVGWRPVSFLDEEEIRYLYRKYKTPEQVIRHMEAVAEYLDILRGQIEASYKAGEGRVLERYDWELLKKAALLHDICRTEKDHAKAGAEALRKEGYEKLVDLVREHHSSEICTCDSELLFYADKRVQEDRVVSVEERFEASLGKCTTPEAKEKHKKLYEKTKYIETKIKKLIGGNEG